MWPGGLCLLTVDSRVTFKKISMFQLPDESSFWRGKGGLMCEGGCICRILQPHPILFLVMFPVRLTIMMTTAVFWNNNSFAECVLQENTGTCVDTKPRGINLYQQCWQKMTPCTASNKNLDNGQEMKLLWFCENILQTHSMTAEPKYTQINLASYPGPSFLRRGLVHTVCACTYKIRMYC